MWCERCKSSLVIRLVGRGTCCYTCGGEMLKEAPAPPEPAKVRVVSEDPIKGDRILILEEDTVFDDEMTGYRSDFDDYDATD